MKKVFAQMHLENVIDMVKHILGRRMKRKQLKQNIEMKTAVKSLRLSVQLGTLQRCRRWMMIIFT